MLFNISNFLNRRCVKQSFFLQKHVHKMQFSFGLFVGFSSLSKAYDELFSVCCKNPSILLLQLTPKIFK